MIPVSNAPVRISSKGFAVNGSQPAALPSQNRPLCRHQLEDLIYHALKEDRFLIYYQPLYRIQDSNFTEAEALLRLQDSSGHFISPDQFIPVAEEDGLITEIGEMVLGRVTRYIHRMLSYGSDIDSISINLSAADLARSDLSKHVLDVIRQNHISPNRIVLEVTESVLIGNYQQAENQIREMSSEGIQFALDDFGTGYSNLSCILDLPFDTVKIDKSLIWDSVKNQKCSLVLKELIQAFKDIHLDVTAEGVETTEHDRFARQCGCDRIQGFRYAKPMPTSRVYDYFGRRVAAG